jgi:hypothetical protein
MIPVLVGILAAIAGGLLVTGIIVLALLTYKKVKEWFQKNKSLTEEDKHKIGAIIKMKLDDGDHGVVTGIFDDKKADIVAGQKIKARKLDKELETKLKGKAVVFYDY